MLELYYSPSCPYCKKVLSFFEANNIDFLPKDVNIPENYDNLIKIGGIEQVPFLVDTTNNKHMYESDKIIEYVEQSKKGN